MKNELISQLYDAHDYLYIHDGYLDLIRRFEKDTESCKQKYLRMKNEKTSYGYLYLMIFFSGAMLLLLGGLLASQLQAGGIVFLLLGLIVAAFVAARKYIKNKKLEPEKNALEFWRTTGSPTCAENEEKIKKIRAELQKFSDENQGVLEVLPTDYRDDIGVVSYMIHVLENGLADSMKDGLHLYLEQKHRWEMEAAIHGMARSMELHNREMEGYMAEISAQQRITNSRLADIEMLTFLDYINC